MSNKRNNTNNNNNNDSNTENNNSNISERSHQERETEQSRQQQHILLMKSNKMFKRCCCYVLILCLSMMLPGYVATKATDAMLVTTDAPPPKRLTTAAEILQLPHAFRHEEHYSHRIEQAVNDFKRAQLQQLKERDKYPTTKIPSKSVDKGKGNDNDNENTNNNNNDNKNKNENSFPPSWQFEPHHRRHEQHYLQRNEQRQRQMLQPEHHLRHSNGHQSTWEELVLPPIRHQRHQLKESNFALRTGFEEGKSSVNHQHTPMYPQYLPANTFRDDFDNNDDFDDETTDDDDDGDSSDDSSDDDSYEIESREFIHQNSFPLSGNSYSAIDGKATAVKRYTKPLKNLKTKSAGTKERRRTSFDIQKAQRNNDGSYKAIDGDENGGNDDSENFTDEEWQLIKDKHYREKKLHSLSQRESQKRVPMKTNNIPESDMQRKSIRQKYRKLAGIHHKRAREETVCRIPQRRVVHVGPEPSKTYTPHCIILHRCADDTGCCQSEGKTCAPKTTEEVQLYFSVSYMQKKLEDYVRLSFINHTECHCVDKLKPDEPLDNTLTEEINGTNAAERNTAIFNCICPKLFEIIIQKNGSCRCDCSSGNSGCEWLKSGMEHFSVLDRKCILEERCKPPTCEFGNYLIKQGRCPRHNYFVPNGNMNKFREKQRFH